MKILQFFIIGAAVLLSGCKYPDNSIESATVEIEVVGNIVTKNIHVKASHSETAGISEQGFVYALYRGYGSGADIQKRVCAANESLVWDFQLSNDFNVKWIRAYVIIDDIYIYSNMVNMYDLGIFLD